MIPYFSKCSSHMNNSPDLSPICSSLQHEDHKKAVLTATLLKKYNFGLTTRQSFQQF